MAGELVLSWKGKGPPYEQIWIQLPLEVLMHTHLLKLFKSGLVVVVKNIIFYGVSAFSLIWKWE